MTKKEYTVIIHLIVQSLNFYGHLALSEVVPKDWVPFLVVGYLVIGGLMARAAYVISREPFN